MAKRKKSKPSKPASPAQKRARERNWNKGQIACIKSLINTVYNSKTTTDKEKSFLVLMENDLDMILRDWRK